MAVAVAMMAVAVAVAVAASVAVAQPWSSSLALSAIGARLHRSTSGVGAAAMQAGCPSSCSIAQ